MSSKTTAEIAAPTRVGTQTSSTSSGLDVDGTAEDLADALSSSLAKIVSGNVRTRAPNMMRSGNGRAKGKNTVIDSQQENLGNRSAEVWVESSSSSSGIPPEGGASGSGPNVVTGSMTASSGEDRDSSVNDDGRQKATAVTTNSSAGDDANGASNSAPLNTKNINLHNEAIQGGGSVGSTSFRNHHSRRQRKRPTDVQSPAKPLAVPSKLAKSADGYGLPVPNDVGLQTENSSVHATVVAHLPPPVADSSSSGSGAEGEKMSCSGSGDDHRMTRSLLQPHREPGFHTIRRTFNKIMVGLQSKPHRKKYKQTKRLSQVGNAAAPIMDNIKGKKRPPRGASNDDRWSEDDADVEGNGGSSGSGSEGGYAGSASSNDNGVRSGSCSSPSVSSSEDCRTVRTKHRKRRQSGVASSSSTDPNRPLLLRKKQVPTHSSSEIADFSPGGGSDSITSSISVGYGSSNEQEEAFVKDEATTSRTQTIMSQNISSKETRKRPEPALQLPASKSPKQSSLSPKKIIHDDLKPPARIGTVTGPPDTDGPILEGKPPILALGCDIMAHVLTFLEPPDILDVLTMPLSKDWMQTFTCQRELWRVLCLLEPFKAQVEEDSDESSDESLDSFPLNCDSQVKRDLGKFRLLYTSFVRCMRYLARIKDDAVHGRSPSVIDYGASSSSKHNIGANQNLQQFLHVARGVVVQNREEMGAMAELSGSDISDDDNNQSGAVAQHPVGAQPIGVFDDGVSSTARRKRKHTDGRSRRTKNSNVYGHSELTQRLLGPPRNGKAGNVELPWNCAIYSIVNWMSAFGAVEGIQTMCLKVLPFLLENEQQRITAQRSGLTDIVLRNMVMFPESGQLHTAAFHTIVLLARPLGGREGMLFHTSMVNSSGIFSTAGGSQNGKNGIAVMLDSMRRFRKNEVLQAMSCWSLVNVALAPAQKEVLVKLGGIEVTACAMREHPHNAEVQFRALFALINLVIPSVNVNEEEPVESELAQYGDDDDASEKEVLNEIVYQIVALAVLAMKNFCASEAILNRACLVLHNLSLTREYHDALLWTPNCYQMLEWCLANYRTDQVLQQSASGTLRRLQLTLGNDEELRVRFAASLRAQQKSSLEDATGEASTLAKQEQRQQRVVQEEASERD